MKYLCIGDLHLTLWSREFIENGLYPYMKDLIACEAIDAVVFLGDILDNDSETVHLLIFDCAVQLFTRVSQLVPTYILVGNHDYVNPHQFLTDRHWMNSLKGKHNLHIVDRVTRAGAAVFTPYVPPGRFIEALESAQWRDARVLFAHQGFRGARWHAGVCMDGDEWSADLPPVISGHIHTSQTLACGIWYPGSVEVGKDNQVLLVEAGDAAEVVIRPIKMGYLQTRQITATVVEICAQPDLCNCEITIRDTREQLTQFRTSDRYKELCARNVVRMAPQTIPFLELYRQNVLDIGDPFVYCAAEKILSNVEWDEENHLFISIT